MIGIIMCVYNSLPVCRQAIEACIARMDGTGPNKSQLVLVHNHSPDENVYPYLRDVAHGCGSVRLFDPGENLGCHHGWNDGYQKMIKTSGSKTFDYVMKLDDDTVIRTWAPFKMMRDALKDVPKCAYVSADLNVKQNNPYRLETIAGHDLEIADTGIVGFSCVMFRRSWIEAVGLLSAEGYRDASGNVGEPEPSLYGGEEATAAAAARERGQFIAHLPAVYCHHLDNAERDPDYPMWKYAYGFRAWTRKDLPTWRESGEMIEHYRKRLAIEAQQSTPNDVVLRDIVTRLGDLSDTPEKERGLFVLVRTKTENGVVHHAMEEAEVKIAERKRGE